jgi:HPt (histidine-containing phosphotransfer) domain-containing protein
MAQQSAAVDNLDQFAQVRAKRPIDLVHLAKQCLGDEHLEYEVLRLFDTTITTYFSRLTKAVGGEDVGMHLHSIKGAASGVGAWTIADLALAAEVEVRAGGSLSAEHVADLGLAIEEVSAFITRMLSEEPA